jgi:hypothetical protein
MAKSVPYFDNTVHSVNFIISKSGPVPLLNGTKSSNDLLAEQYLWIMIPDGTRGLIRLRLHSLSEES